MLEVGKAYHTRSGSRKFHIIGKRRQSNTGHYYIGECSATGLITYFNATGAHQTFEHYSLDIDLYLYMPILPDGSMGLEQFVKKKELPKVECFGYFKILRRAANPLETVTFQKKLGSD